MKSISKDQAFACITHKEFSEGILLSAEKVVVVLTQSWCPQWLAMKPFIDGHVNCKVYYLEYDLTDYFDKFREFKEKIFGNDQIPYIRYYQNGRLTNTSNFLPEDMYRKKLGIASSPESA
jgi:hypothetical protein